MMNVVQFPQREISYRFCECGCSTHYLRHDDVIECAACGNTEHSAGNWRSKLEITQHLEQPMSKKTERRIVNFNDPEIALERVLKRANAATTKAVVIINDDGHVSTWGDDFETEDQQEWLRDMLREAQALLLREGGVSK